jgi:hypothetical protein
MLALAAPMAAPRSTVRREIRFIVPSPQFAFLLNGGLRPDLQAADTSRATRHDLVVPIAPPSAADN